jgi:hypothetical protein
MMSIPRRLRKWWREPFWHFMAVGLVIFVVYGGLAPDDNRIEVSRAHLEGLRQDHLRQTGRIPTPEEEAALIQGFFQDEVLLREALRMGLDQGDPIVRRRLIQRMEFLMETQQPVPEPTREELVEYFERHPKRYTEEARVSLKHVFLKVDGSADDVRSRAQSVREELISGKDPGQLGDPFLHGYRFERKTRREVAAIFGSSFSESTNALKEGVWTGPIESSYGFHLVMVTRREEARVPAFEEVRPLVLEHLRAVRKEAMKREAVRRLSDRYEIQVEGDGS